MDWHKMMERELKRAKTGSTMTKIPKDRKPSAKSLVELEEQISETIKMHYKHQSQKCK